MVPRPANFVESTAKTTKDQIKFINALPKIFQQKLEVDALWATPFPENVHIPRSKLRRPGEDNSPSREHLVNKTPTHQLENEVTFVDSGAYIYDYTIFFLYKV